MGGLLNRGSDSASLCYNPIAYDKRIGGGAIVYVIIQSAAYDKRVGGAGAIVYVMTRGLKRSTVTSYNRRILR